MRPDSEQSLGTRANYIDTSLPKVTFEPLRLPGEQMGPWEDVPVQRVPVDGEFVQMVDDLGLWKVVSVEFRYVDGFAFEPDCIVQIVPVAS